MKKLLLTLIITMIVLTMNGCGGNKTQTNNEQPIGNSTNQVTEDTNNDETSTSSNAGSQTNEISETKMLEDIQLSDQRSGKAWKYDSRILRQIPIDI